MPRDVTEFFEQYRDAFNRLDGDAVGNLFCVPSGIVSDRGLTAWQSRESIAQNMVALCALYRANGYKQAHFAPNHFISQCADFAVADVDWSIECKAGTEPIHIHTQFTLYRQVKD